MVKISFIASGIILGLATISSASASIISRSFLDQALTDYATTTALDLKANQSDFTDLNTQISDSVDLLRSLLVQGSNSYDLVLANPEKYPNTISGAFSLLYQYLDRFAGSILYGWTDSENKTYLGVKGLNDKIGTLPEGITVQGMYEGWTDSNKFTYSGLNRISSDYTALLNDFNTPGLYSLFAKGGTITIPGYSTNTILPLPELSYGVSKIGTLPSGNVPFFPGSELLFPWINQPDTYPTSLAELITAIYGNSETGAPGLLQGIIAGFGIDTNGDGINESNAGTLSNFWLAKNASDLATTANTTATAAKTAADANTAKIGDLPTDTTVAGMMGNPVLIGAEQTIIPLYDLILLGSKAQLAINPISGTIIPFPLLGLLDLTYRVNKIGDLPTEYTTVGAALTAMKSDIDAKNLPSSSDDGQYVLSAKKVGDTITYTWVKMDLTNEEQAQ